MKLYKFIPILLFSTSSFASAPMTFDQALQEIITKSDRINIQKHTVEKTKMLNMSDRFFYLPNLSANFTQTNNKLNDLTNDGKQYQLTGTVNLFRFGADYKGYSAALSDNQTQSFKFDDEILRAEEEAVEVLISFISLQQQINIQKKVLQINENTLKIATERYNRGLLPLQEVDKINVDLENDRSRLIDTENKAEETRTQLVTLLGHDQIVIDWPWKSDIVQIKIPEHLDIEKLPNLQTSLSQINTEQLRYEKQKRLFFPSLDLSMSLGRNIGLYSNYADKDTNAWSTSLTLTIPIFERFSTYGSANAQYENLNIARIEHEQNIKTTLSSWESAKKIFLQSVN